MANDPLKELGVAIAQHSEEGPHTGRVLEGARRRLLIKQSARPHRRAWPRLSAVAATVIALFAAGWFSGSGFRFLRGGEAPLTFEVESRAELTEGLIEARGETKQLKFSDGSSLSLDTATAIQVQGTSFAGASVLVRAGRTHARVTHREESDWRFRAGPFEVEVTGTEFDIAWDPDSAVFELALHEGSVRLRGPGVLGPGGLTDDRGGQRVVRKGDYVKIALGQQSALPHQTVQEGGSEESAQPTEPKLTSPGAETEKPAVAAPTGLPSARTTSPEDGESGWRRLLGDGDRDGALAEVRRVGVERATRGVGPRDLWTLAEAARLRGAPDLARQVLLLLRSAHGERGQSAFLLGKVAADQSRDRTEAVKWFEVYLKEVPQGGLREQALGRLVELQKGTARGRQAAEQYLSIYPQGTYAELARASLR